MFVRSIVFLMFLCVASVEQAVAGIIVTLGNPALNAGDSSTIDVSVTGAPTNVDLVDFFVGAFRITAIGGAVEGGITFDDPQLNPFDTDPGSGYVFAGNTFGLSRAVTQSVNPQDLLTIVDGTADFLGVDVNSNTFLLARIEFTAASGLLGISQYQISFLADQSQFLTETFDDISFGSSGGLLTVTGASAAVPEPASGTLAGTAVLIGWYLRRRRQRS